MADIFAVYLPKDYNESVIAETVPYVFKLADITHKKNKKSLYKKVIKVRQIFEKCIYR